MQIQRRLEKETVMKEWDAFGDSVLVETSATGGEDTTSEPDRPSGKDTPDPVLDDVLDCVISRVRGATSESSAPISQALYNALRDRISEATESLLCSLEYERGFQVPESQSPSEVLYRYFRWLLIPHIVPACHLCSFSTYPSPSKLFLNPSTTGV
ncbi:hypothetical protein Holit_01760 [Hollandina sp. SP2]